MKSTIADWRVFWKEFRRAFHTTGAVLPSGRRLAEALARPVALSAYPQRVLEVGPGTGAVTAHILRAMGPNDRLDLVELNDSFVARLRQRFDGEPLFQKKADRVRIFHQPIETLDGDAYDAIVSGLPLNNFSVAQVEQILAAILGMLRPGGTLSFFEYVAIRPARSIVSGSAERERLRGIGRVLGSLLDEHACGRKCVWLNVPPAWVHYVKMKPLRGDEG